MSDKALSLPDASSGPRSTRSIVSLGEGGKFTPEQVELVKRTVCRGASDDELSLFLHVAQRSGLDPFAKQIYAIRRRVKVDDQYREVMTIQTGIDGFRVVAARTSQHAGTDDAVFREGAHGHPEAATVTVWKIVGGLRVSYTATARWAEYAQTYKDGNPAGMWAKMPYTMLAKCAEALALRKAFPMDLSGIYSTEEMTQADVGGDRAAESVVTVHPPIETTGTPIPPRNEAPEPPTASPAPAAPAQSTSPRATAEEIGALGRAWKGLIDRILEHGLDRGHPSDKVAAGLWLRDKGVNLAPIFNSISAGTAESVSVVAATARVRELMTQHLPLQQPPEPAAPAAARAQPDPFTKSEAEFDGQIPF